MKSADRCAAVYRYHERSKHRFDAYAAGPSTIDWDDQPSPWRRYDDAEKIALPLTDADSEPVFDQLYKTGNMDAQAINLANLAGMLRFSLGLAAWKSHGRAKWALRCNPSSGNLHPTEAYLLLYGLPGIDTGLYHYLSFDHCLVKVGHIDACAELDRYARTLPLCLIFLTSIPWREAWKYGERSFRYCQLDAGHALASLHFGAATLGWELVPRLELKHQLIDSILGLEQIRQRFPAEAEYAEYALQITAGEAPKPPTVDHLMPTQRFGQPIGLGARHHYHWPLVDDLFMATATDELEQTAVDLPQLPDPVAPTATVPGRELLLQRRSAQAFDPRASMSLQQFTRILDMTLPRPDHLPWQNWPSAPQINLVLFVHAVEGLTPGLYVLVRDPSHLQALQQQMRASFVWTRIPAGPDHLRLYHLVSAPARKTMKRLSCLQDIAGDSCFALAMLARFEDNIDVNPGAYRNLYWEAGLIGQVLYLEAEQASMRGTGIGCFFDDGLHELLGIQGQSWQDLYHFTVGHPVTDSRLVSLSGYHHLQR